MKTEQASEQNSNEEKVCRLISELTKDFRALERQEKLGIVSHEDAESTRKSIRQSIADLRAIYGNKDRNDSHELNDVPIRS